MLKITELHIFDFDGTLVDSSHRYRTDESGEKIDLQFWIDNEDKTLEDSLLPLVDKFRTICEDSNKYAIIATARIWCDLTSTFARINKLIPNSLVARRDRNDHRGGAQLKISHVNRLLNLRQFQNVNTIHIYEDNYKYLMNMMDYFKSMGFAVVGHFSPSNQGH